MLVRKLCEKSDHKDDGILQQDHDQVQRFADAVPEAAAQVIPLARPWRVRNCRFVGGQAPPSISRAAYRWEAEPLGRTKSAAGRSIDVLPTR